MARVLSVGGIGLRGDGRRRHARRLDDERARVDRQGLADLLDELAQMRRLEQVETAGAVLGRVAPAVLRVADEDALRHALVVGQRGERQHLVDDAGQLEPGLRSVDLRDEDLAVEVVELLVEDPDEDHVLRPRVLQMGEPGDHLAPVQPVGAAHVRLARLVRMRLGLALAPLEAEPPRHGDRVDEHRVVLFQRPRVAVLLADRLVVVLAVGLVLAQRGVRAADEHREVAAFPPGARADRVDGQPLDGEIARLEVEEQRRARLQRAQERGLAGAARAEDCGLHAAHLGQPLVGGDDGERGGHAATARAAGAVSRPVPVTAA